MSTHPTPTTALGASMYSGGQAPVRAPQRGGTRAQLLLALLCAGFAVGSAVGWGSDRLALIMGDFGLSLAAAIAAVSNFVYARSSRSRFRPAWLLFAFSSLMASFGNGVWGWYEVVLREPVPTPSLADLFFLCFAPPAIIGLLVLARRPVTKAGWICLALDAWLIAGSLVTLSWSLALAHTAEFEGQSVTRTALSLAYPLLDIALVSMVLALHFRRSPGSRTAVNTAIGALALTVMCDALFTSPLLHASYRSGEILDAGWFAGSLLLAYAPWVGTRRGVREEEHSLGSGGRYQVSYTRPISGSLAALTPYLAAAVCTLGILYNLLDGHRVDRVVLFTACTVVLALVMRQGIMLLDNITLTQELAQKENHFRSLVQGSSDVIMIAAPNGTLRYVSPAAAGVYGRDAEDLVGSELASIIHPEDLGRVMHEVRRFLAASQIEEPTTRIECRFRSGTGTWLNVESTVNRHHGGLILNSRDVTERVRLQAQLQHNAEHDPLTDLPNRSLFTKRVGQALAGRRAGDLGTAVLFIDLDGFKQVNDTIGHQAGDELLVVAARRLAESVRASDTAARLGGDEFAALIVGDGGATTPRENSRSTSWPTGSESPCPSRTRSPGTTMCGSPPPSASPSPSRTSGPVSCCATPTWRCTGRRRRARAASSCTRRRCRPMSYARRSWRRGCDRRCTRASSRCSTSRSSRSTTAGSRRSPRRPDGAARRASCSPPPSSCGWPTTASAPPSSAAGCWRKPSSRPPSAGTAGMRRRSPCGSAPAGSSTGPCRSAR